MKKQAGSFMAASVRKKLHWRGRSAPGTSANIPEGEAWRCVPSGSVDSPVIYGVRVETSNPYYLLISSEYSVVRWDGKRITGFSTKVKWRFCKVLPKFYPELVHNSQKPGQIWDLLPVLEASGEGDAVFVHRGDAGEGFDAQALRAQLLPAALEELLD